MHSRYKILDYPKSITFTDSPYTVGAGFNVVSVNAASGKTTVNLPLASVTSYPIRVQKTDSSANYVEIVDTVSSKTWNLRLQYQLANFFSNGTRWDSDYIERNSVYTYIALGAGSKTGIAHGLAEAPTMGNKYRITITPDGRDSANELVSAVVTNIGATTVDVELDTGVTVSGNRYFMIVFEKVT